jgi:tetratricopeptide (TPR) repeat protein
MTKRTSQVKVWEDMLTIPTYQVGPDDQNPPILIDRKNPIHPGSSIIYPYPIQEVLTTIKEDKTWRAIYLENDFLRLIVLPDLGGHLLSAFDKISGEEAIYRNHVLKYARIGIRGAWVSGGIEWNFPNGHTVTTTSPIDYAIRENDDGSRSVVIGDIERVSRMRWSVTITLYPQSAFFETEVRLFNRTFLPNRFWYWANSATPSSPGLEFITTASKVMTLQDVMDYPMHEGVNIRWDRNHMEAQDLFSLNSVQDFVAWYNHDLERGLINYADRTDAPGKKFFTWGNSDAGKIWTELLTEEDGPYSEMQSGRLLTMRIWEMMSPCSVETWRETWYPIRKIGTPVFANREAAFSLHIAKDLLRLGVHVNTPQAGAQLSIYTKGGHLWSDRIDLDPEKPYIHELSPGKVPTGKKALMVELKDSDGMQIAKYEQNPFPQPEREIKGYIKIEPDQQTQTPEELWEAGAEFEKIGNFSLAEEQYERAIEQDTGYSPAHRSLGILHLRRGNFERALIELKTALDRNLGDDGATFYLGTCLMYMERYDEAVEEFLALSRSSSFGAAGAHALGGLYLGKGDLAHAIVQLRKAHRKDVENTDTLALLACTYRKKGDPEKARVQAERALRRDPLNFIALFEDYLLSTDGQGDKGSTRKEDRLRNTLRDEQQSYLELAADYARFGLHKEAAGVLTFFLESQGESESVSPILLFTLGYYQEKLGSLGAARKSIERGTTLDHSCVFPHRVESEKVLRRVLELIPRNGKTAYYLGNLLCAKDRRQEALELWELAVKSEKDLSVIHRNLGRSYMKVLGDPDRAAAAYEKALRCDPGDYKLYYELDKLYTKLGIHEKRKELIQHIPDELKKIDMIAERIAHYYTDMGEYDRALDILGSTQFFPWEFYTEGRNLYEEITIGKGIALMEEGAYNDAIESFKNFMKYPRNMGVGEPHRRRHAEPLYRIGLAYEKLGKLKDASKLWEEAIREEHAEGDVLRYYQARSLQKLGKKREASAYLEALKGVAERNLIEKTGKEEDNLYLLGLVFKGKGDTIQAMGHFKRAVAINPSMRRCTWETQGRSGE